MKIFFWTHTLVSYFVCIALVVTQMQKPAIVVAAEVLAVAGTSLVLMVPILLMAIYSRISRFNCKESS